MGIIGAAADEGAAGCPAYPWPNNEAQGARKVFMSDCSACHSMFPYATSLRDAVSPEAEPKLAEIIVVNDKEQPVLPQKMLQGQRRNHPYTAHELRKKMELPTPVWLQFLQPYITRAPQTA